MRVVTSGPEVASSERIPQRTDKIIILLSSVGSSERLLTARSLVRVQQGEPQKKRGQAFSLFLWLPLLDSNQRSPQAGFFCFGERGGVNHEIFC